MGYFFIMHVCSEYEVFHKANGPISDLPPIDSEFLNIDGNPVDEGESIF